MTAHFERDLDELKRSVTAMGAAVEANIRKAIAALVDRRDDLVGEVVEGDDEIDAFELKIDEQCHQFLALHQPVAADLRFLLTVSKVNNELERMGDHAKHIAEAASVLSRHEPLPIYDHLTAMADYGADMVSRSLDALVRGDAELAQRVWDDDEQVDREFVLALDDITRALEGRPDKVKLGMRAMGAARDLERIADIATNIAKDVIFLVRGRNVAHRRLQEAMREAKQKQV